MADENNSYSFPALLILVDALVEVGADRVKLADRFQSAAQEKRNDGDKDAAIALELLAAKADPNRYSNAKLAFDVIRGGKSGQDSD